MSKSKTGCLELVEQFLKKIEDENQQLRLSFEQTRSNCESTIREIGALDKRADEELSQYQKHLLNGDSEEAEKHLALSKATREEAQKSRAHLHSLTEQISTLEQNRVKIYTNLIEFCQQERLPKARILVDSLQRLQTGCFDDLSGLGIDFSRVRDVLNKHS